MINICDELSKNFIDYTYEVNSQRAFPDVRDGLKPGQRACIWEMYKKGYFSNKNFVKSAKVSGGIIASWSPHGDSATYDTFVRMSQPWINNYPEVDWHGNNGNIIIGPEAAASRYTETKLAKITEDGMLQGLKKNNVPMKPNYLEDDEWPVVLPAIFPRLMVNGSQGIGSTIAQTWLNYNLKEVSDVILKYAHDENINDIELYPDFPTGGILINKSDTLAILKTGKGKAIIRGRAEIKGNSIFITELPYQVYVEPFIEEIRKLILDDEITTISDIYNKSDKKHPILIEVVCESNPQAVLTKLYASTSLQKNFNANQMALLGKTPMMFTLARYIDAYLAHNVNCVRAEYQFDLNKAQERKEIVDGLLKALENIDNIIALIKKSESTAKARTNLMETYNFTENQAKAIVDMKLGKLAHMEAVELNEERAELDKTITDCLNIVNKPDKQLDIVLKRLEDFTKKYARPRRTEVLEIELSAKPEKEKPIIESQDCIISITANGQWKRGDVPKTARRNTVGSKNKDNIVYTCKTNTTEDFYIFDSNGKMYKTLVNDIPETLQPHNYIGVMTYMASEVNDKYIFFATKKGYVKKVAFEEYKNIKKSGVIALGFHEGDSLATVTPISDGNIMLVTKQGMAIMFNIDTMPVSSRTAKGVIGIKLNEDDEVICALPIPKDITNKYLITVLKDGNGKKIPLNEFKVQNRGGKGISCTPSKDFELAGVAIADNTNSLLVTGDKSSVNISIGELPETSRTAFGNILIKGNKKIVSISLI